MKHYEALDSFACASGEAYSHGQKISIADEDLVDELINAGLIREIQSPTKDIVQFVVDYNLAIVATSQTPKTTSDDLLQIAKDHKGITTTIKNGFLVISPRLSAKSVWSTLVGKITSGKAKPDESKK